VWLCDECHTREHERIWQKEEHLLWWERGDGGRR
jgi:hypothetical protein